MNLRPLPPIAVLVAAAGLTACAPAYVPECRGGDAHPLDAGELAEPSGMALHEGRVYVASAASASPEEGDFDYCGSFITVFDAETGRPIGRPIVPSDPEAAEEDRYFRFFADMLYDTRRDALLVAERQRGAVLRIDPQTGRVIAQATTGGAPYTLALAPDVATTWNIDAERGASGPVTRDVLAVGDLGESGEPGGLWVLDAARFSELQRVGIPVGGSRPTALAVDTATDRLFAAILDGFAISGVDLRTLRTFVASETIGSTVAPAIRGVALPPGPSDTLFHTAEQTGVAGLWQADRVSTEVTGFLRLQEPPFAIAPLGADELVGLSANFLYVFDNAPLTLTHTIDLGAGRPSRMLVDEAGRRAYVSMLEPSSLRVVELP